MRRYDFDASNSQSIICSFQDQIISQEVNTLSLNREVNRDYVTVVLFRTELVIIIPVLGSSIPRGPVSERVEIEPVINNSKNKKRLRIEHYKFSRKSERILKVF